MLTIRPSEARGHVEFGWLDTRHSFSFGHYHDPAHMGFRALRVINEDRVDPGAGFDPHPHRDMEILTYVLSGALEHQDSMGNGSVIRPGDVQRMTAGTGVVHSEQNASATEPVHLLQIWLLPARTGLAPGYEQKAFPEAERRGRLRPLASADGREGSVTVHQDVTLYSALLGAGESVRHALAPGRHAWVQVARGAVSVNGETVRAGDGVALSDERSLALEASEDAELLLFDLA
jgi:hypothetical protein